MKMRSVLLSTLKDIVWNIRSEYEKAGMATRDFLEEVNSVLASRKIETVEKFIIDME